MIPALQLALGVLILGGVVWIGDLIAGGIEGALGDKPLREREPERHSS